jgi:hypothetical protein
VFLYDPTVTKVVTKIISTKLGYRVGGDRALRAARRTVIFKVGHETNIGLQEADSVTLQALSLYGVAEYTAPAIGNRTAREIEAIFRHEAAGIFFRKKMSQWPDGRSRRM